MEATLTREILAVCSVSNLVRAAVCVTKRTDEKFGFHYCGGTILEISCEPFFLPPLGHRSTAQCSACNMQTSDLLRHQLIKSLTTQRHEKGADAAVDLWTPMATQLILIIGAGGFDSLYARSVFVSQSSYPWLAARSGPPQTDHRFADLKISLQAQSPTLAREANCLLLITFTDILASIIGERLTARILDSAWDIDTQDKADKEINNV